MKRLLLLAVILATFIVGVSPTLAAKPLASPRQVFTLERTSFEVAYQVWPQGCNTLYGDPCIPPDHFVYNPSVFLPEAEECLWNVDDHAAWRGYGRLESGTYTASQCVYNDWGALRINRATLRSDSPDLLITMTFQPSGYSVIATPLWWDSLRQYQYSACVEGPTYQKANTTEIPDSNGGYAVLGTVSISITNSTGRTLREVSGGLGIGASNGLTRCDPMSSVFVYNNAAFKLGL